MINVVDLRMKKDKLQLFEALGNRDEGECKSGGGDTSKVYTGRKYNLPKHWHIGQ